MKSQDAVGSLSSGALAQVPRLPVLIDGIWVVDAPLITGEAVNVINASPVSPSMFFATAPQTLFTASWTPILTEDAVLLCVESFKQHPLVSFVVLNDFLCPCTLGFG